MPRPKRGSAAARRRPSPRSTAAVEHPRSRAFRATPSFATRILDTLERIHPEAACALHHRNAYELLAATILSAQCTDQRVNMVTPALFERYPTPADLAVAQPATLEEMIRPTGFFRAKARSLIGCARRLVEQHAGMVPKSFDAMVRLPGVGRKTASVVLGHAYGIAEGIAVDTHVLRVANRLGVAHADDPERVEQQLMGLIPRERWIRTTDLLIFHGRKICGARKPACGSCPLFGHCRWKSRQAYASVSVSS